MGVKLVVCNEQLERPAQGAHSSGSLLWGSKVASGTCTDTVAWAGCPCGCWALGVGQGVGRDSDVLRDPARTR